MDCSGGRLWRSLKKRKNGVKIVVPKAPRTVLAHQTRYVNAPQINNHPPIINNVIFLYTRVWRVAESETSSLKFLRANRIKAAATNISSISLNTGISLPYRGTPGSQPDRVDCNILHCFCKHKKNSFIAIKELVYNYTFLWFLNIETIYTELVKGA